VLEADAVAGIIYRRAWSAHWHVYDSHGAASGTELGVKLRNRTDGRVHFSDLKAFAASPAHYKYAIEHPPESTRAMTVGSIADRLVFGGGDVVVYSKVRRGGEWEQFAAEQKPDALICIQSEYDEAEGAAAAVKADAVAGPFLRSRSAEFQQVVQWEANALPFAAGLRGMRGGFDLLDRKRGLIGDLKITADAEPETLSSHAFRMLWHAQAACYLDGARSLGWGVDRFLLFCVESTAPHPVTVLELTEAALEEGRKSIALWCEALRRCEQAGEWPGYCQSIVPLKVPPWMGFPEGLRDDD
jgi:hypothetical protein